MAALGLGLACSLGVSCSLSGLSGAAAKLRLFATSDFAQLSAGRTVGVSALPEILAYRLRGAMSGGEEKTLATFSRLEKASLRLEAGTWDFILEALDAEGLAILTGRKTRSQIGSGESSLSFVLAPPRLGLGLGEGLPELGGHGTRR